KTTTKRHHPEKEKTRRKYRRVCQRSEAAFGPLFYCRPVYGLCRALRASAGEIGHHGIENEHA
ncbi:hypothetical protein, partial [Agrobacterium salinitolerans]|uniref:hypothetical protein n=2 Tax=Agrobacterium salinitolerans TaxID=1183413 RepID=UPI00196B3FC1